MKKLCIFLICLLSCNLVSCSSSNDEKVADLESRVSYLEKQLGVSSINKEDKQSSSITELQKVLDSYEWSPNFKDTNYKYGCYEVNDLNLLNKISAFYGNDVSSVDWAIYGLKGNSIARTMHGERSDLPHNYIVDKNNLNTKMYISYSSLNSKVDANNLFNSCNDIIENVYTDDNLLVKIDKRDLYEYSTRVTYIDTEVNPALSTNKNNSKSKDKPIATYMFVSILYKDDTKLFHECLEFDVDKYDEVKSFLVDTTKAVGIDDIESIYTKLLDKYKTPDENSNTSYNKW